MSVPPTSAFKLLGCVWAAELKYGKTRKAAQRIATVATVTAREYRAFFIGPPEKRSLQTRATLIYRALRMSRAEVCAIGMHVTCLPSAPAALESRGTLRRTEVSLPVFRRP